MLEPREADIPILFLVLVVLPVVVYILLGKWGEASEKRGRINFLSQMASDEALRSNAVAIASKVVRDKTVTVASGFLRAETADDAAIGSLRVDTVTAASVVPLMVSSKSIEIHVCARCLNPAKTRCSRCKSVRYCSGECQIIHWRLAHKDACVPAETCSASCDEGSTSLIGSQVDNASQVQIQERRSVGKRNSCKSDREPLRRDGVHMFGPSREFSGAEATCATDNSNSKLKKNDAKHKLKSKGYAVEKSTISNAIGNSRM